MIQNNRNKKIDLLRGIAISLVLLLHFGLSYKLSSSYLGYLIPKKFLNPLIFNGNYGVTIFFTISGFLISSISQRRYGHLNRINLREFYWFRFSRIIPPLLLALILILTLGLLGVDSFTNTDNGQDLGNSFFGPAILSVLTFWHNILMQEVGYFNYALNIYWSLSVEEVFYLFFPLFFVFTRSQAIFKLSCLIFIVLGPIYRYWHRNSELYFMYGYFACFDAISIGCLASLYKEKILELFNSSKVSYLFFFGLIITYFYGIYSNKVFGFSLISFFSACILIWDNSNAKWLDTLLVRGIRWMGVHCYELYLFHIIILGLVRWWMPGAGLNSHEISGLFTIYLLISFLTAYTIARYISNPLNNLLRSYMIKLYDQQRQ